MNWLCILLGILLLTSSVFAIECPVSWDKNNMFINITSDISNLQIYGGDSQDFNLEITANNSKDINIFIYAVIDVNDINNNADGVYINSSEIEFMQDTFILKPGESHKLTINISFALNIIPGNYEVLFCADDVVTYIQYINIPSSSSGYIIIKTPVDNNMYIEIIKEIYKDKNVYVTNIEYIDKNVYIDNYVKGDDDSIMLLRLGVISGIVIIGAIIIIIKFLRR